MLASQSEFNRRITRLQDSIESLTNAQEQKTAAEYFYIQAQEKKVWEEVREQIVKSDVAEETKEAMITKTTLENFNLMQAGIESITRTKNGSGILLYSSTRKESLGRITLGIVAAGVVAKKILGDTKVDAELVEVGGSKDIDKKIEEIADTGDSIGGIVECRVKNVPVALGEPFFDSCEALISHMVFAIPATK